MMDREKAYIPELQISFMEHIAMPIYKYDKHSSSDNTVAVLARLHFLTFVSKFQDI